MGNDVVPNDDRPRRSYCISALFVLGLLALTCCVAIMSVCALSAMEEAYMKNRRKGLSEEQLEDMRFSWFIGKLMAVVASLLSAMGAVRYSESIGWRVTCKAAPGPMSPLNRVFFHMALVVFVAYCQMNLTLFVMEGIGEALIRGRGEGLEKGWAVATLVVGLTSTPLLFAFAPYQWLCPSEVAPDTEDLEMKTSDDVRGENNV